MFLGVPRRLVNSERSINALPDADPDTTLLIADNDDEAEVEAAPARHHPRHAARGNCYPFKLPTLARPPPPPAAPPPPPPRGATGPGGPRGRAGPPPAGAASAGTATTASSAAISTG